MQIEPSDLRFRRKRALDRAVERLDRQIVLMQAQSKRLSTCRLITFISAMVFLIWPSSTGKWIPAIGAGLLFLFWIVRHHLLHLRIKHFQIIRDIKKTNLARMMVQWEDIPEAMPIAVAGDRVMAGDLELLGARSLHHLLDISISERGSRKLAHWLTCTEHEFATILRRQEIIRELVALPRFRDRMLLNFHLVSSGKINSEKMTKWLNVPLPKMNMKAALIISILLLFLTFGLFTISDISPLPSSWLLTYGMYLLFFFSIVPKLAPVLQSAQWLDDELSVFRRILLFLERYPLKKQSQLSSLLSVFRAPGQKPSQKIRSLKISAACIGLRNNPIMTFLLNMCFPWDLIFALWTLQQRKLLKRDFSRWLETLSKLEAMSALANFSDINPDYCFPTLSDAHTHTPSPLFKARSLGHPLISPDVNVTNDYEIEKIGDITLLTGSNMAGKSTFLKTVGINLILAYSGGPVHAVSLSTIFFRICTCIKIEDSLADGVSSFYAEVRRLREVLNHIRQDHPLPVLFFIDEILRGTNNRERLIGSTALVRALTQTYSAGLISTHDLELTSLSTDSEGITNYHFAETIKDDKMFFSYRLRRGPCPTTNALHIMRKEGLPIPT